MKTPALRGLPLHSHYVMNGTNSSYFDPRTDLLIGPVPWAIIGGYAAATLVIIAVAAWFTQRGDFA